MYRNKPFVFNNSNKKEKRKYLRENSGKYERLLWTKVRKKQLGFIFRRQYSIGPYFVDFYCPQKRLVIELDGNVHQKTKEYDSYRTKYFEAFNIKVIRFNNDDLDDNIIDVMKQIRSALL